MLSYGLMVLKCGKALFTFSSQPFSTLQAMHNRITSILHLLLFFSLTHRLNLSRSERKKERKQHSTLLVHVYDAGKKNNNKICSN